MSDETAFEIRAQRIHAQQRAAWLGGDRAPVESWLARRPELKNDREALLDLIYAEFCLRRELGELPTSDEYCKRFPELVEDLMPLFEIDGALDMRRLAGLGTEGPSRTPAEETLSLSDPPLPAETVDIDDELTPESSADRLKPVTTEVVPSERRFGDYVLLSELGRGGMGVVYKAHHESLKRFVALKMVLAGEFADPDSLARFKAEAETLAALAHPHIVQIHEIGRNEGLPYIALEFVSGGSLAQVLDGGPMPPRTAALLLGVLARAVHAAHQRGIVHRDLKPANVLLAPSEGPQAIALSAEGEGRFEPKITDFGLAKQLASDSARTASGAIIGTPSYMAPEQAAGRTAEIGPAADIYALGAILYWLLTGRPPFAAANVVETLKQVVEDEAVSPRRLNSAVDRDLETICLKCLSKEPKLRYESAADLADELARFGEGRPIYARPLGRPARLWRWCRRNPVVAGLLAAAAALLLVPAIGGPLAALRESRLRAEADRGHSAAHQAVNDYFVRISGDRLLHEPGFQPLRKDLLESARRYYSRFVAERASDPRSEQGLAETHFRLGLITAAIGSREEALESFQASREIYRRIELRTSSTPALKRELGRIEIEIALVERLLGRHGDAKHSFKTALDLLTEVDADDPIARQEAARGLRELGMMLYFDLGESDEAGRRLAAAQEALEKLVAETEDRHAVHLLGSTHLSLANLDMFSGRVAAARFHGGRAIELYERLTDEQPVVGHFQLQLARAHINAGQTEVIASRFVEGAAESESAIRILERLHALNPQVVEYQVELAAALGSLAGTRLHLEGPAAAGDLATRAAGLAAAAAAARPEDAETRVRLAAALLQLHAVTDDDALALERAIEAQTLIEPLVAQSPNLLRHRTFLAVALIGRGAVERKQGNADLAGKHLSRAVDELRAIRGLTKQRLSIDRNLVIASFALSGLHAERGDAVALAKLARGHRTAATGDPISIYLAASWLADAAALTSANEPNAERTREYNDEALDALDEAVGAGLGIVEGLLHSDRAWAPLMADPARRPRIDALIARAAAEIEKPGARERIMIQMLDHATTLSGPDPGGPELWELRKEFNRRLGEIRREAGDWSGARPYFEAAVAAARRGSPIPQDELAGIIQDVAATSYTLGDYHAAAAYFGQCHDIRRAIVEADPSRANRAALAFCLSYRGSTSRRTGDLPSAREFYRQAHAIYTVVAAEQPDDVWAQTNLASVLGNLGDLERQSLDVAASRAWLEQGIGILGPLASAAKLNAGQLGWLTQQREQLLALDEAQRLAESPDDPLPEINSVAADCLVLAAALSARGARHVEAQSLAARLANLLPTGAENRFLQARAFSRCAEASPTQDAAAAGAAPPDYRAQAFAALRDAVAAGWSDASALATETDLIAVREDREFRDLMRELVMARETGPR